MLLVTGITGHTGRYFLNELINNDYQGPIRCLVRKNTDTTVLDKCGLNIEKVEGDLNDPTFIDKIMCGVHTVMHIYNIHHSPMIVKSAINNIVKRVILVHTTGIYSNFKDASIEYKNIEREVYQIINNSNYKLNFTILRPTMIYGDMCDRNISKFIKLVDKLRIIPVINKGENLLQPVNARDLGKAYYNVLISPQKTSGKDYNLSGEKPITMIEIYNLISKGLNKKTRYINLPLGLAVFIAKFFKKVTLGKFDYIEKVQRMGENRSYSHSKAKADFGYSPMTFENGLQNEIKEYLEAKRN